MLTNGWRRFRWEEILDSNYQVVVPRFTDGFEICGSLKQEDIKVHGTSALSLLVMETGDLYTTRARDGRFCFSNVIFEDTSTIIIQSVSTVGPSVNLAADLDPPKSPMIEYVAPQKIFPTAATRRHVELNDLRVRDEVLPGEEFELLREVVVQEDRLAAESKVSNIYGTADAVIDLANSPVPYPDLLTAMRGKVPGLQITGGAFNATIRISGSTGEPLVIVDGVPINDRASVTTATIGGGGGNPGAGAQPTAQAQVATTVGGTNSVYNFLQSMNPNNVDRIEVLRRGSSSMYGSRGGNGVLIIYTKTGVTTNGIKLESQVYQGFNVSRQFYAPKYVSVKDLSIAVDRRSTLHWEPFVVTNEKGRATVRFYNSDEATSFNLVLQGVSKTGQLAAKTIRIDFAE